MSCERVLLLFDRKRPVWTPDLVSLAGEDPGAPSALEAEGLLHCKDNVFSLTGQGRKTFRTWAAESWLDAEPGEAPGDTARSLMALEASLLFERGFRGFHGAKRVTVSPELPYRPRITASGMFSTNGDDFTWLYPEDKGLASIVEHFPRTRPAGDEDLDEIDRWLAEQALPPAIFRPDMLCVNQCDYQWYWRDRRNADRFGFLNSDRLFARLLVDPEKLTLEQALEDLGGFGLFLANNRHLYLPGCFDIDTQQQSCFTWWFWITGTEDQASRLAERMNRYCPQLVEPMMPVDLWTMSLQRLRAWDQKAESFYEFVDALAIPVSR
ncbi:MAG: hypothetical protein U9R40_00960 [Synergistota bacterium]|nr:hypothetical protein [Synergistota bacterium]